MSIDETILLTKLNEKITGFRERACAAAAAKDWELYTIQYTIEVALINVADAIRETYQS